MSEEAVRHRVPAADVQTRARAAGLELDAARAAALAPICDALARADRRLNNLPIAGHAAAGPPWGPAKGDDRR